MKKLPPAKKAAPPKPAPKRSANAVALPRLSAEEQKWRAREDLQTMQRAAQISSDKGRLKAAQVEAKDQINALAKVVKG